MIVFTDENLSPRLAQRLELVGMKGDTYFTYKTAPFERGMGDTQWIPLLHNQRSDPTERVLVFSGDAKILRNEEERRILKDCNFGFVLGQPSFRDLPWKEQAWRYLRAWPRLKDELSTQKREAVYELAAQFVVPRLKIYIDDLLSHCLRRVTIVQFP